MTRASAHAPRKQAPRGQSGAVASRITGYDWQAIAGELGERGCAVLPRLLSPTECRELAALYAHEAHFRSRIRMAQHGFGKGEYRYFRYPLPKTVAQLRTALYAYLAPLANDWNALLGVTDRYPAEHTSFLQRCHEAGQSRPTPLLLKYEAGDFNCLHQDVYGALVFPLQLTVLLSEPGRDFRGGEFVLTEQRPRRQSRVEVVPLAQGDGVVFAVRHRPVRGSRGVYRANLRHGVSLLRCGVRHTLGIIFHDAA